MDLKKLVITHITPKIILKKTILYALYGFIICLGIIFTCGFLTTLFDENPPYYFDGQTTFCLFGSIFIWGCLYILMYLVKYNKMYDTKYKQYLDEIKILKAEDSLKEK